MRGGLFQGRAQHLEQIEDDRGYFDRISVALGTDGWRLAWTRAELGVDTSGADRTQTPGRWRRLAFYEGIDHAVATDLIPCSDVRQLFAHGYAYRTEARAIEVWQTMHILRGHLEGVIEGILKLQERLVSAE